MSLTLPEPPTWMQNRTYSARLDRQIVQLLFSEGVLDIGSGELEVRATTAPTNAIEVVAGNGIVAGDDEPIQGHYFAHVGAGGAAFVSFAMPPAPLNDQRVDLIVLRVNDSTSGSTETPVDAAVLDVIQGVDGVGPVAPALPPTAIPLAEILRTAGDTFVDNGMITDLRVQATQAQYTTFSRFEVLTSVERDALVAPAVGRTIFNTTTNRVETFDGVVFLGTGIAAVTTVERDALTGLFPGFTVLNTDVSRVQVFDGSVFRDVGDTFFAAMTTAQRDLLNPFVGQVIFNTDTNELQVYDGAVWQTVIQPAASLATLTDVNLSGLVDGDFLQYDNSSGNWLPAQIVIPPPEDPIPLILALS